MAKTGAQLLVKALENESVRWVFGIPGTHNIEFYDAMIDSDSLTPVLITDEQSAGFMAHGAASASGEMAAISLVPGAGLTHAFSGIAECYLDQVPLLVLLCGVRTDIDKAYQLHDIDQASMARPVSKKVFQPRSHEELLRSVHEACGIARTAPHGPVVIEIPANLFLTTSDIPAENIATRATPSYGRPDPSALGRVVELLNQAEKIGLYVGNGAVDSSSRLPELADLLDAVVFTTISGKGVFPESHPRFAWNGMGRSAPPEIASVASDCDCLLAIGCRFGEVATASYGISPPKTLIHVDIDPTVLGRNYPAQATLACDATALVEALLRPGTLRERKPNREKISRLSHGRERTRQQQVAEVSDEKLVRPATLFDCVQEICGQQSVYVADSGNGLFLSMERLKLDHPRSFLGPVDYSCMGYSVPAAIGAKLAAPERPVAAFVGDGAFLMTGLELATAVSYSAGVMLFLLRDRELSQIAQFQKASLNRTSCTELPDYRAAAIAEAVGATYLYAAGEKGLPDAVVRAFELANQRKPVIVEVPIDYSRSTYFSKGVVKTNFLRFPWKDRIRLVSRVIKRKLVARAP